MNAQSRASANQAQSSQASERRTLTDWTRLAGYYASVQEVQKACPLSSWRLEEAMFRLLGRGYQNDRGYPIDLGYQGAMYLPTQAMGM